MTSRRKPWLALLPLCLAALGAGAPGIAATAGAAGTAAVQGTAHLDWGLRLIREVTPATNAYASRPTVVTWAGVDGASESRNRSVCSSLVAHLLMQAQGYRKADFKRWMGTTFPQAQDFHDAIAAGHGFTRIDAVSRIRPGDIVAIKYPPGSHPTGHVLVVVEPPAARPPTPPEAPGTVQYELRILDSSRTGHGPTDTRHYAKGKFHSGVGQGLLRLYVTPAGRIAAYSWSVTKASQLYSMTDRDLVVGRLDGTILPGTAKDVPAAAEDEPEGDLEPPG
jgi:hypothetical protein